MSAKILAATSISGGTVGALDNIPSYYVEDGDLSLAQDVKNGNTFYLYKLDEFSGATENPPFVIKPDDTQAGDKRWILRGIEHFPNDITLVKTYKVNTEYVKAIDQDGLKLYNQNDQGIFINNSGDVTITGTMSFVDLEVSGLITSTYPTVSGAPFVVASTTMVTNLNSHYLGGVAKAGYLQKTEFEKGSLNIPSGSTSAAVTFASAKSDAFYNLQTEISNTVDASASVYAKLVFGKTTGGFNIRFSDTIDANNYRLDWLAIDF